MINRSEKDIVKDWPTGFIDNPVASIRCTTYNHARYVAQAIDSFLMQETSYPFEIVIHDDASTDNTQEIICEYQKLFPNIIKLILQTENQYSKPGGRKHLKELVDGACKGKYIAWCEGDDYWLDCRKLQKQIDYLETHPDCSMVFNSANYVNDTGVITFCDKKQNSECDFDPNKVIRGGGSFCATASICMRSHFSSFQYRFQSLADVGDYPLQIALSLKGKIHYLPEVMTAYRVSEGNANSWTNRITNNKNMAIEHCYNEIDWLSVLDDETEHKYSEAVSYSIYVAQLDLFDLGAISKKELFGFFLRLRFVTKLRIIKRRLRKIKKEIKIRRNHNY